METSTRDKIEIETAKENARKNVVVKACDEFLYLFIVLLSKEINDCTNISEISKVYDELKNNYLNKMRDKNNLLRIPKYYSDKLPLTEEQINKLSIDIDNEKRAVLAITSKILSKSSSGNKLINLRNSYIEKDSDFVTNLEKYKANLHEGLKYYMKHMYRKDLSFSGTTKSGKTESATINLGRAAHLLGLPEFDNSLITGRGLDRFIATAKRVVSYNKTYDSNEKTIIAGINSKMLLIKKAYDDIKKVYKLKNQTLLDAAINNYKQEIESFYKTYKKYESIERVSDFVILATKKIESANTVLEKTFSSYSDAFNSDGRFAYDIHKNRFVAELTESLIYEIVSEQNYNNKKALINEFILLFDDTKKEENIKKLKNKIKDPNFSIIFSSSYTKFEKSISIYYDEFVSYFKTHFKPLLDEAPGVEIDSSSKSQTKKNNAIDSISSLEDLKTYYQKNNNQVFTKEQLINLKSKLIIYSPLISNRDDIDNLTTYETQLKSIVGDKYNDYFDSMEIFEEDTSINYLKDIIDLINKKISTGTSTDDDIMPLFVRFYSLKDKYLSLNEENTIYKDINHKLARSDKYYRQLDGLTKISLVDYFTSEEGEIELFTKCPTLRDYESVISDKLGEDLLFELLYSFRRYNFLVDLTREPDYRRIAEIYGYPFVFDCLLSLTTPDITSMLISEHINGDFSVIMKKISSKAELMSKIPLYQEIDSPGTTILVDRTPGSKDPCYIIKTSNNMMFTVKSSRLVHLLNGDEKDVDIISLSDVKTPTVLLTSSRIIRDYEKDYLEKRLKTAKTSYSTEVTTLNGITFR